ncbi:MAG: serine/threonine-protein kinase, partial [Pirellulaceae bacterium]|nr:serine/threonine-protein kinase [Pirellulaceae bacterium]
MIPCLTEQQLRDLAAGKGSPELDAHLVQCPVCTARLEQVRGAVAQGLSTHHEATKIDMAPQQTPRTIGGLERTLGSAEEPPPLASLPPPAPAEISVERFLINLSESGLFLPAELEALRAQAASVPARMASAADLQAWLVVEQKLTRYQADLVARGQHGGLVLGNYVILDKIGQGGMGAVFKARHRRMNRVVALKVLPAAMSSIPEAITRFQREVEAVARLSHPNIAAAYDADEAAGLHFLVMEHVDGPNLASYVRDKGALPIAAAVRLLAQAARGLAAAHAVGVVHRDIKPSNLMVNRQGKLKILDMGLAQMRDSGSDVDLTSDVTQTGRVMGTVDYMAPEQARDAKSVDYRADIYSLGCTAYYLLAGNTPAPAGSAAEKLL